MGHTPFLAYFFEVFKEVSGTSSAKRARATTVAFLAYFFSRGKEVGVIRFATAFATGGGT